MLNGLVLHGVALLPARRIRTPFRERPAAERPERRQSMNVAPPGRFGQRRNGTLWYYFADIAPGRA